MQGCEQHCPDMEELDMENCKAVTDVGIMAIENRYHHVGNHWEHQRTCFVERVYV